MIIPGFENELSSKELDIFDHGRYDEVVQMLSDLGYLFISDSEGEIVSDNELGDAVKLFRKELLESTLIDSEDTLHKISDGSISQKLQLLSYKEFYLLHEFVSLDGDFILNRFPEYGSLNIYSRVLQYRLHLLGFLDRVGFPIDSKTNEAWGRLRKYLPNLNTPELLSISGDINALLYAIKDCPGLNNRLVCFKYQAITAVSRVYSIRHALAEGVFYEQYKANVPSRSEEFKDFRHKVHGYSPDLSYLQELYDGVDNDFLIRLIQLYQWSSGYYHGKIDGFFGEYSFNSFLEFGKIEVEGGNRDFQLQRFVGHVSDDYWVANVHYLLDRMEKPDERLDTKAVLNTFYSKYDELSEEDKVRFNLNMESAWKEANRSSRDHLRSSQHKLRRIYFGIKNMLHSFWKGLKHLFGSLIKDTKEFVQSITNGIKSFAKFLYKEIREAIYMFAEGMAFLFGKREYSADGWTTRFDFDCDLLIVHSADANQKLGIEHMAAIRSKAHNLDFCLCLTGKVIHFILLTQGAGWRRVIMEAGVIFKQMIKERIKKRFH